VSTLVIYALFRVDAGPAAAAAVVAAAAADEKNKECIVYVINRSITTMPSGLPAPSPSTAPSSARAYEYSPRANGYPSRPALPSEDLI